MLPMCPEQSPAVCKGKELSSLPVRVRSRRSQYAYNRTVELKRRRLHACHENVSELLKVVKGPVARFDRYKPARYPHFPVPWHVRRVEEQFFGSAILPSGPMHVWV